MFKANNQPKLFSFENQLLDKKQQELLDKTLEKAFYNIVFSNIKESDYKVLFSENGSRAQCSGKCFSFSLDIKRAERLEL